MLDAEDGSRFGWLRPVAAGLAAGLVSGLGSFYVAARPEVQAVERHSEVADVLLCEAANENRLLLRRVYTALAQPELIPTDSPPALVVYINERNLRRQEGVFLIEDATRPLNCNEEMHAGRAVD